MKALILGAGLAGVTSAYLLATRGYDVTVVDRQPASAREGSYSNGGQLSYSHAEPWANPGVVPKAIKWMFQENAPLILRPRADLDMITWGMKFLTNCTQGAANANTVTMLRLGLYSKQKLDQIVTATGLEFDLCREGILHIFQNEKVMQGAIKQVRYQETLGCTEHILSVDECLRQEPILEHSPLPLIGGIHAHLDEVGDALQFVEKLTKICQQEYNVTFHYNTTIESLETKNSAVTAVKTSQGKMTADHYVMALGVYSAGMLRKKGIKLPIHPMKGYSVSLPANMYCPQASITDQEAKIVYTRLGDRLRIAGTAEFAGYNTQIVEKRINHMLNDLQRVLPKAAPDDLSIAKGWACLRPSTPDGPPILGSSPLSNLFLNTGHGTLGWTQAAGSAFLLADVMEGKKTEISLHGLTAERYL